jgi:hypothetical protein
MPAYFGKEEIINNGKRYRIHNNYLTIGGGYFSSTRRAATQKPFGVDLQFHIKKHEFQVGGFISGNELFGSNNLSTHLGYGWRKENANYNFVVYTGLEYSYGVYAIADTDSTTKPYYYSSPGLYVCTQAVRKLTYDIGIGIELYAEVNTTQFMGGIKFIVFFSDAYRGLKRNYNPNVRLKK